MELQTKKMTNTTDITTKAKLNFLIYVRTLEIVNYRKEAKGVFISQKYIENKFFPYPEFNRKDCLDQLEADQQLKINKGKHFTYEALEEGEVDLNLIPPVINYENKVLDVMKVHLANVSKDFSWSPTSYFDTFLNEKESHLNHFFKVDSFGRRVYTPITSLPKVFRGKLLLYGTEVASLDVVTMQPLLLGKILEDNIGSNEFSDWINKGEDIYKLLQERANLSTRKEAKEKFFEILFSKKNDELETTFGGSNWIQWINKYKTKEVKENPRTNIKRHSNLAWLLQSTEVRVMYSLWEKLVEEDIAFLTVHDEVIVQYCNVKKVEGYFNQILKREFKSFKLSINKVEEIQHPFDMNELQIEELAEDVVNDLCLERSVKIVPTSKSKKLKKEDMESVMNILEPYLSNQWMLKGEINRRYFGKHKSLISKENQQKVLEYFQTNRVLINNKYGRFDFKK